VSPHKTFPKPAPKPKARRRPLPPRSANGLSFMDELNEVRPLVQARSGGSCECGTGCGLHAEVVHHRLRRSQGGTNALENLAHLSGPCHRRVHNEPAWSYANGLLLRRTQ
jgi:5-methylcytosine-specific restriction endonuclease McrA